jgi:Response regulator containing a CheY-like receiver domain and an HD-GYP domain
LLGPDKPVATRKDTRFTMAEKILVVDDSKLVTDIVKMRLGMYGYEVRLAHSGEEALKAIEEEVPDLLVLDVHMPGIDGYEVCRRLRDNPAFDDLRIIMLTSSDDKHAAFEAGVDDYLNKDVDLLNLPNRVKMILEMD